jgi:hypothetical protein
VTQPIEAAKVKAEPVDWLWGNRIPRRMVSIVAGRPDSGKGLFASRVAADVTQQGGHVLYSAAEDSFSLMTRPRLEAAGADLSKVLLWRFALPRNGYELGQAVMKGSIDLIVMDPMAAHLTNGISRHSDNVRTVLEPLTELIEEANAACLIIEHSLKRIPASGHILDVIGGSGSGLTAAARTAFVLGRHPDDPEQRVIAPAKFNIGEWPKALAFDLDTETVDPVGDIPFLADPEPLEVFDPMRMFKKDKEDQRPAGRPPDKRAAAAEWLTAYLVEAGGPVLSSLVQEDAKQNQLSQKTLKRAAEDMGVVKNPPGGGRNTTWDLPDDVKQLMGIAPEPQREAPKDSELEVGDDFDKGLADLLGSE